MAMVTIRMMTQMIPVAIKTQNNGVFVTGSVGSTGTLGVGAGGSTGLGGSTGGVGVTGGVGTTGGVGSGETGGGTGTTGGGVKGLIWIDLVKSLTCFPL